MADFTQNKGYKFNWNKSKFKDLAVSGSNISVFVNDAGYLTSAGNSFTGSFSGSFFGSLTGTSSYSTLAATASYFSGSITNADFATLAATASYFSGSITNAIFAETASYVAGLGPYNLIVENDVSASVSSTGNIFLIKSASINFFTVDDQGTTTFNNNSGITTLKISQSGMVNFLTQSSNPIGNAPLGGFWFTSHSLYIGLE